jgi:hypothetical protein
MGTNQALSWDGRQIARTLGSPRATAARAGTRGGGGRRPPEPPGDYPKRRDLYRDRGATRNPPGHDRPAPGGDSLSAGFITSAAAGGATVWKMQAVSRHKTLDVLSGYVRDAEAFKDHAGAAFL